MSDWDFEPGRPLRVPSTCRLSSNAAHTVPDQTFRRARGKFGHTSKGGRGERSAVREVNETTHRRSAALPFRRFFDLRIFGSSSSSVSCFLLPLFFLPPRDPLRDAERFPFFFCPRFVAAELEAFAAGTAGTAALTSVAVPHVEPRVVIFVRSRAPSILLLKLIC